MTHKEALNEILSNTCGGPQVEGDTGTFVLTLHCVEALVTVKSLGWNADKNQGEYEILDVEIREEQG